MECYHTVKDAGTGEITEKKSRFIADVFPVLTEEEAFAHLEEIRKKYWDARHHCWAYVIGSNPASERMSDDGEPAGTAPGQGADGCVYCCHPVFRRHTAGNGGPGQGLWSGGC